MGFTSLDNPFRVNVKPLEILSGNDSSGSVVVGSTSAHVRAFKGRVTVRNAKTGASFVLDKGQDRIFGLDGSNQGSIAEIASNVPPPLPNIPPQTPAGQTGGLAMDTGAWLAVIAGAAVAGVAITGLVIALNNRDDLDDIRAQNDRLSGQITDLTNTINNNNATTQARLQQLERSQRLSEAAFNARLNALAIAQTSSTAQTAVTANPNLTAAQRASFNATAASIAARAQAQSQTIANIQAQIDAVDAQLAAGTITPQAAQTQLDALQTQLNNAINTLNAIRAEETAFLNSLAQVGINVQQTSTPSSQGSATIPD
jgi:hypothetical protein